MAEGEGGGSRPPPRSPAAGTAVTHNTIGNAAAMPRPGIESGTPFSDAEIGEIERAVGRELPAAYRDFVRRYGGAFFGGSVDGSEDLPVLAFFGARGDAGILSKLRLHPDLRELGAVPFADCELGNLYVLSPGDAVYYINYYGGKPTARKVSESFGDFAGRIVVPED